MINLFGEEWYSLLKDFLNSDTFMKIGLALNEEYNTKTIVPPKASPLYFKVFKDLQPSKIKCVILGLDPYPQINEYGMVYTGYAFDNANSIKLSPSLRNIFKEIDRTYPENELSLDYGNLDRWDLSRWVKQGVFLVNTALSVVKDSPGTHVDIWRPFTEEWIERLSQDKNELIWLLWGRQAQEYEQYINPINYIIKTSHPSPLNRRGGFVGSGCFLECNNQLVGLNKEPIIW